LIEGASSNLPIDKSILSRGVLVPESEVKCGPPRLPAYPRPLALLKKMAIMAKMASLDLQASLENGVMFAPLVSTISFQTVGVFLLDQGSL
jgi:hypothetical protein